MRLRGGKAIIKTLKIRALKRHWSDRSVDFNLQSSEKKALRHRRAFVRSGRCLAGLLQDEETPDVALSCSFRIRICLLIQVLCNR